MTTPPLRLLLVEDSQVLAEKLLEFLTQSPSVRIVGVADTESRAVELLSAGGVDAVVLDLRLRQGTGFGVLARIGRGAERPQIVVLTNYNLDEYRRRAAEFGVVHFLDKSREFAQLPALLEGFRARLSRPATEPAGGTT